MSGTHLIGAVAGAAALLRAATAQPEFHGIGQLPGYRLGTEVSGLSADGTVVVGTALGVEGGNIYEAIVWRQGVLTGLGRDPGTGGTRARAVSGDGAIVFGQNGATGVRWVSMIREPFFPPGMSQWYVFAASDDGSAAAGPSWLFRDSSWVPIQMDGYGLDISGDGNTLSGWGQIGSGFSVFHLLLRDGSRLIPPHPLSERPDPRTAGISHDATAVFNNHYIWLRGSPIIHYVDCNSWLRDVSDGGGTAVGWTIVGNRAIVWNDGVGLRDLHCLLDQLGIGPTGWSLTEAIGVSADGTVIVGNGVNPAGTKEGWIARIPRVLAGPNFDPHCDLNIFDFLAYQNSFALAEPRADLDGNSILDIFDFLMFQNLFAAGCR